MFCHDGVRCLEIVSLILRGSLGRCEDKKTPSSQIEIQKASVTTRDGDVAAAKVEASFDRQMSYAVATQRNWLLSSAARTPPAFMFPRR